jgi:hypothetical protein
MADLNMAKGLISMPATEQHIVDVSRRFTSLACRGYDWLGYRPFPKVLVIHRSQSPNGVYVSEAGYYDSLCCPALTDLEVNNLTGHGKRFVNVPGNTPSGWASGPISVPYGDGKLFNDIYPLLVNVYGESCEVLGHFNQPGTNITWDDPVEEPAIQWLIRWIASRAHDYGIPYYDFPVIRSERGRSYVTWHEEYTFGTGKVCPGPIVKALTPRLINDARAVMKAAQTLGTDTINPEQPDAAPDGLPYPEGIDGGILALAFGVLTQGTKRFSFNPAGVISKAWYKRGKETGSWPFLFDHFVDTENGREMFFFSDGSQIYRPDSHSPYRWAFTY